MGGGILGGSGVKGNIADILVEVFDRYDIEPGELNENINDAVVLIKEFAPVIRQMNEITDSIETDVEAIQNDLDNLGDNVNEFKESSEQLASSLDDVAESLNRFNQLVEEAAEAKDENE